MVKSAGSHTGRPGLSFGVWLGSVLGSCQSGEPSVGPGEGGGQRRESGEAEDMAQGGQGRAREETWDWSTEMVGGLWLAHLVARRRSGEWSQYWSLVWGLGLGSQTLYPWSWKAPRYLFIKNIFLELL